MIGDRTPPPRQGSEREILTGMLDFVRGAVVRKLEGLTEEQARSAPVPPSTLTPGGLVKHLTGVERFWFSLDFAGLDLPLPWPEDDRHGAFALTEQDTVAGLVAAYRAECARSEESVAAFALDDTATAPGMDFTLRFAYAHLIQETARHAGHLDLLRERIDGRTGQ
ncbi:MAG TPA: DinB family protein [Mycobacteriales bacterium]|nr:DinB family protein [Mycobacteriales bacterium]